MFASSRPRPPCLFIAGTFLLLPFLAAVAHAQNELQEPRVTALSRPDAASMVPSGAPSRELRAYERLSGQQIDVAPNAQVMFYSPSGAVAAIAMGPARFRV